MDGRRFPAPWSTFGRSDPPAGFPIVCVRRFGSAFPVCLSLLDGLVPSLVFYDESSHRWNVIEPQVAPSANGSLAADVVRFGQYAFVVPDSGVPPLQSRFAGQPLAERSGCRALRLEFRNAFATASPAVAVYGPEAQSTIKVTADPATKFASGVWCEASFDERYDLRGQSEPKLVERASQTFVLYSYPAATGERAEPPVRIVYRQADNPGSSARRISRGESSRCHPFG